MLPESDLSFLNKREILEVIFPVAYESFFRSKFQPDPLNSITHYIEVEGGCKIGCKFFYRDRNNPTIFYFHGNGETVFDHDWLAPLYLSRGVNLFVTDYRGYGASNGCPDITNLFSDAHILFETFKKILLEEGFRDRIFVMGRSLGSVPAVEIACHYQKELRGLILESASAENFLFLRNYLTPGEIEELIRSRFLNKTKIQEVTIPTLIIHGELDEVIAVDEGIELFENSGAEVKSILIVPNSGHNDLMFNEEDQYFSSIENLVKSNS
jgi:alpha-beta hydrolase superfamily lysophospholipase